MSGERAQRQARPEHTFAPVIGPTGCVGHVLWTPRGVRAFDADGKELDLTYPSMDAAAAALLDAAALGRVGSLVGKFA